MEVYENYLQYASYMYVIAGSSKKMSAATATAAHKTWIFNSTSTATFTVNFDLPF